MLLNCSIYAQINLIVIPIDPTEFRRIQIGQVLKVEETETIELTVTG